MFTAILCICAAVALWVSSTRPRKSRPPGPPGEPILGNARQIPKLGQWTYFADLAKSYGDVVYLTAMGQPMLVISSSQAMSELLAKNSSFFSGRPHLPMLGDLVGWDRTVILGAPTNRWQAQRKLLHQFLGPGSVPIYHQMIEELVYEYVRNIIPTIEGFMDEFVFTMAKLTIRMAYGMKIESPKDPVLLAEDTTRNFEDGMEFGKYRVDLLPLLKYLPAWFPLIKFHHVAAEWKAQLLHSVDLPFGRVKEEMATGKAEQSFTSMCLESLPAGADDEHIKWASGVFYLASARTTTAVIGTFLYAMILHPEIQAKAQTEIDGITSGERLPTLADRPNLPYIDCILKEVMRWHPPAPLGLPHTTTEEVEFREMVQGTIVFNNGWTLSQDPAVYGPDTDKFDPERFVRDPIAKDPRDYAFGWGRRRCPGDAFADATAWITFATLLASVNMRHATDKDGNPIPLKGDFNTNVLQ
ncbi:cytochrome P450 [Clavulina sp. PMI_390]|nr:cytochrome P450 [Clavulina sp. PMI_390]